MKYFSILLILAAAVIGCKYLKAEQKVPSELADASPMQTSSDAKIVLNSETQADAHALGAILRRILAERENNGIFIEGTNEVANYVVFAANPEISIGKIAEVGFAIEDARGQLRVPIKKADPDAAPPRPNPLSLLVTVGDAEWPSPQVFGFTREAQEYSTFVNFQSFDSKWELKFERVTHLRSIEISADGEYFINEVPDKYRDEHAKVSDVDVKQRKVDKAALIADLPNWVGISRIQIFASEKAAYGRLLDILIAGGGLRDKYGGTPSFDVWIRPHDLKIGAPDTIPNKTPRPRL